MTKVYPSFYTTKVAEKHKCSSATSDLGENAIALTVWTKSLLFNCKGFTVFNATGDLVFRVDNYIAGNKGEIVLMDACGKPLYTIRRKRLSLSDNWQIFDGEKTVSPQFTVKKHMNILNGKCAAIVSAGGSGGGSSSPALYEMEGSYTQRAVAVYDQKRRRVAEIRRKEAAVGGAAIGSDVFRLLVEPQLDSAFAMSLVIVLDQMFGSSSKR